MAERTGTAVQRAQEAAAITPAKPESLIERMDEIFNEISKRAFEMFEGNGHVFGRELDDWVKAEREFLHPVQIQVSESGDTFEVKAEVPGFTEKELEITAEPGRVTISGKRETSKEEKKGKTLYSETGSDEVLRIVDVPTNIDTNKITATLTNGILTLVLPKAANARTVRIQPKAQ